MSIYEVAIPDVIEDCKTGFLVPQKDANALEEKLELLINDSELRNRMGRAGREKYKKEFTLAIFEKRMKEILEELIVNIQKFVFDFTCGIFGDTLINRKWLSSSFYYTKLKIKL